MMECDDEQNTPRETLTMVGETLDGILKTMANAAAAVDTPSGGPAPATVANATAASPALRQATAAPSEDFTLRKLTMELELEHVRTRQIELQLQLAQAQRPAF